MIAKKAPNPTDKAVGQRVKMARLMKGMSQERLGDAVGLTFQQIQKYEKGANRIGASRMQQIADALEQPVSYFFGVNDEKVAERGIVEQMLTTPYGLDLARDYLSLKHNQQRHVVATVARTIASAQAA